ncbi:MAG TPA: PSD1 and planctomycete cytochrome C domain-containing protein [Saprospiraceae bacterium]|nr:PSD1 and planctomycete cytochrome C domain-containing protein [Saprospiraceae bacterium]
MRRPTFSNIVLATALLAAAIFLFAFFAKENRAGEVQLPEVVSFNFHIRPILSDRCFKCHGPDEKKREAGLRFDTQDGAFAALNSTPDPDSSTRYVPPPVGGGVETQPHYAIVPYHPEQSTLIQRIFSTNPDSMMPAPDSHLSLSDFEKKLLKKWIEQGAKWEKHWAFIAPQKPDIPEVKNKKWARNEVDFFILQKQQEHGLEPSIEAEKERLVRRASFDLTGLPPSPEMVDNFLADDNPDAYEKVVDALLASPAYGERWAVYWLDLARYSDTHGYQDDLPRVMWPWRDWVIKAFNENMPYDRFVTWQLAGDLLPDATKETLLASAFNRNHKITQEGGVIDEEYRVEYVADRTNTFSKAFLGLTMECARCHDHKYDPISTRDYYATSAFFNKVPEQGFVPNLATPKPYIPIVQTDLQGVLSFLNGKDFFKTGKDTLLQMVMRDSTGKNARKTYILKRGQYDQHGEEVTENLPANILPFDTAQGRNRLAMARWLFDPRHPLTARVMVNRLWQEVFGKGIVATSDNFGLQGALPSHPELLDWLACDLRDNGWNMKRTLRLLVTSATYRQSSAADEELLEKDPENRWLVRGPRYRLNYEFIRDNALAASGLLVREIGGPSVKPYQPPGLWEEISADKTANDFRGENSYKPDTAASKIYRRSLYTYNRRTIPPPTSLSFDAAPRDVCEVNRARTSTPLQALVMLNDVQMLEAARVLAMRTLRDNQGQSPETNIAAIFRRVLTRKPERIEIQKLAALYNEELTRFQQSPERAKQLLKTGRYPQNSDLDPAQQAAMMLVVSAIFNLDEAVSKT